MKCVFFFLIFISHNRHGWRNQINIKSFRLIQESAEFKLLKCNAVRHFKKSKNQLNVIPWSWSSKFLLPGFCKVDRLRVPRLVPVLSCLVSVLAEVRVWAGTCNVFRSMCKSLDEMVRLTVWVCLDTSFRAVVGTGTGSLCWSLATTSLLASSSWMVVSMF